MKFVANGYKKKAKHSLNGMVLMLGQNLHNWLPITQAGILFKIILKLLQNMETVKLLLVSKQKGTSYLSWDLILIQPFSGLTMAAKLMIRFIKKLKMELRVTPMTLF